MHHDINDPPDYDKAVLLRRRKNRDDVVDRLNNRDKYLLDAISTFARNYGYSDKEVEKHIREDEYFRCFFAKDPTKQGIHEKTAKEYLRQLPIDDFKKLPTSGNGAYFITSDGVICKGMENPPTKSLDFFWKFAGFEWYITHKYTKASGGSQDNQFNDVKNTINLWQKGGARKNQILVAIVDGDYYTDNKFAELRHICREKPPYSFVLRIHQISALLKSAEKGKDNLAKWIY